MFVGRDLTLEYPTGTVIAGVRTRSFAIDASPIDVTTDDDSALRTLLEEPGQRMIDISVEGLLKNDALLADIIGGSSFIQELTINLPFAGGTPGKIVGDFRFNNFESSGEYQGSITFSATLQSTGAFTYTPAVP